MDRTTGFKMDKSPSGEKVYAKHGPMSTAPQPVQATDISDVYQPTGSRVRAAMELDNLPACGSGISKPYEEPAKNMNQPVQDREAHLLWLATRDEIFRYLMACTAGRINGALKAKHHENLVSIYVAWWEAA